MSVEKAIPWDWYDGTVPANVALGEAAYVDSTFSFREFRSELQPGMEIGRGACVYKVMLDVGRHGRVSLGDYSTLAGGRVICDGEVAIGRYCLISWNVVIMDCYRFPLDPARRRALLAFGAVTDGRVLEPFSEAPRPVRIGDNVWLGFDACVLPGVSIGEGSVVGARAVVAESMPPYSLVAGNPARRLRALSGAEAGAGGFPRRAI